MSKCELILTAPVYQWRPGPIVKALSTTRRISDDLSHAPTPGICESLPGCVARVAAVYGVRTDETLEHLQLPFARQVHTALDGGDGTVTGEVPQPER